MTELLAVMALIFASSFETGDFSEWDRVVGAKDDQPPVVEIIEPKGGPE